MRGRWVVLKSLGHYVQECMSFLNEMRLTEEAKKLLAANLAAAIPQLGPRHVGGVVGIIQAGMPSVGAGTDEIEAGLSALDK